MKPRFHFPLLVLPLIISLHAHASAQAITKQTTGTDLTAGASWVGGVAPGSSDVATWATGSLGGALTIGSALSWQGIDIQAASAAIITSGAGTLTLGSSGITLAAAGVDLTLGNSRTFGATSAVTVGTGRKLTLGGGTTTFASSTTTSLSGAGTMEFASTSHTITGSGDLTIGSGFTLQNNLQSGSSATGRSGATTLNGGTISITSSISIFGTGAINLNSGAIGSGNSTSRDLGTANAVVFGGNVAFGGTGLGTGGIRFGGTTDLGGVVRTITSTASGVLTNNGAGAIFNGVVSNGGIIKEGAGYLTLGNNSNTFTGAVTINAGNLAFSQKALANASSVTLANSGVWLVIGENGAGTHDIKNLSGVAGSIIRSDFGITGTSTARILKIAQSSDSVFAGSFTEGSSGRTIALVKEGSAKLTLSGTGGYTAGTTLSQGTLVAANSSALGSSGTITINDAATSSNNTTLNIDATGAAVTIARAITVANQGSGNVTLGASTTGGANAAIFSGAITLAKDVTLNGGSAGDRFSTTGGISGTGNVTISGTNRVVFSGAANSYIGSTTINSNGILQLSDGTADADSFITDNSAVTVNSGAFLKLAKGGNSETIGALTGTGTIEAISGNDTLIVGSGDATSSFGGALKNNGGTLALTKTGNGTLTLTGFSSNHTGATIVSGGSLVVNGNISTSLLTTVQTGATIGGSGTVGALTIDGNGTLAPGTSPGTLYTGALTLAGTSISAFELNPADFTVGLGINDLVSVTGNLTLDGILNVAATSGNFLSAFNGEIWRLFNYTGSLTNNTLSLGSMPSLSSGLTWDIDTATAGQINLVVVPEPAAALLGGLGLLVLLRRRRD